MTSMRAWDQICGIPTEDARGVAHGTIVESVAPFRQGGGSPHSSHRITRRRASPLLSLEEGERKRLTPLGTPELTLASLFNASKKIQRPDNGLKTR